MNKQQRIYIFVLIWCLDDIFTCAIASKTQFDPGREHLDTNLLCTNLGLLLCIFQQKIINYTYVELLCHVNFVCQQNLRALMWWELFSVIYFITFLELFIESPINCAPGCVLLMDTKSSPILLQLCHSQNFVLCKQKFICLRVAAEQAIKGKMYHLEIYHVGSSLLWWKCHSAQPGRHVSFPRNTMEYFTPR